MRDRFEIVHLKSDGTFVVLARSAPKKSHHRWEVTHQLAGVVLRGTLQKTLTAGKRCGLLYAYESLEHPEDGTVGIREKE